MILLSCKKNKDVNNGFYIKEKHKNNETKTLIPLDSDTLISGVIKEYYSNGVLEAEYEVFKDSAHGLTKTYYKNGNLESKQKYIKGKREGKSSWYYEDGEKKEDIFYVNDIQTEAIGRYKNFSLAHYERYNVLGHLVYKLNYNDTLDSFKESGEKIIQLILPDFENSTDSVSKIRVQKSEVFNIRIGVASPPNCKETFYAKLNNTTLGDKLIIDTSHYKFSFNPKKLGLNKLELFIDYECIDYNLKSGYKLLEFEVIDNN